MKKLAKLCDEIGRLHGIIPRLVIKADAFGLHSMTLEWERWNHTWRTFHTMFPDSELTFKQAAEQFVKECREGLEEDAKNVDDEE